MSPAIQNRRSGTEFRSKELYVDHDTAANAFNSFLQALKVEARSRELCADHLFEGSLEHALVR